MAEYKDLEKKVVELCKQTVRMTTAAGGGYPASSLSIAHIVTALMYSVMRYDPQNPWLNTADRLILSAGHAVPVVYAAYCDLGGMVGSANSPRELTDDDAMTFCQGDGVLEGRPSPAVGFPFFDSAGGSLGQGLSVAAGLACAARLDGSDRKLYVIIGDGEAREGQIAEALDYILDHKLTAVRCIFNCNGQGQSGPVSPMQSPGALTALLEAKGFDVNGIDGHDLGQVIDALTAEVDERPVAVVAKTIKGWGSSILQSVSHLGTPQAAEGLEACLEELDAKAAALGVSDADDSAVAVLTAPAPLAVNRRPRIQAGTFNGAVEAAGMAEALEQGMLSAQRAYGAALMSIGADPRVVATDADVKDATFAHLFAGQFPERYFEAGIAEQNMVAMAVGLAAAGKIPFASTFARFFDRAYDQVEMAAISNANVKLVGSHAGVSLAGDGAGQMGVSDLAMFRALAHAKHVEGAPACRVFMPSDAVSAFKLTELMANLDGLCYMRTHAPDVSIVYDEGEDFHEGGYKHLIDGTDLTIVSSGYMVHVVRDAIRLMEGDGLEPSVIDVYALPLARPDEILRIGDDCNGQILVVEDNYVGGVCDEIAAAAAASDMGVTVRRMVVNAVPRGARTTDEILQASALSARHIADAAQGIFDQVQ